MDTSVQSSFHTLGLSEAILQDLAAAGFSSPTPIQEQAVPPALAGRDVIGCAQTGTGKTAAFVIPMVERLAALPKGQPQALILAPTRELALQTLTTIEKLGRSRRVSATVIVGGADMQAQVRGLRQRPEILIATPGRLLDHMWNGTISLTSIKMLVLDEADRMLDMGFLPAIERIIGAIPESRQTLLFSATIEKSVAPLIGKYVKDAERISIGTTTRTADNVDLHVYEVEHDDKVELLNSLLKRHDGSFLVFARTKRGTDRLAKRLATSGVKAIGIHGDRTQNQRNQALRGFREGYYRVMVATDVAARGIHVDGIAHVVNFDLPQVTEDFIHRAGRTGRAGQRGVASTFATSSERGVIRSIEREIKTRLAWKNWDGIDMPDRRESAPVFRRETSQRPAGNRKPRTVEARKPFHSRFGSKSTRSRQHSER